MTSDEWVQLDTDLRKAWRKFGSTQGPGGDVKKILAALLIHGPQVGNHLAKLAGVQQSNLVAWNMPRLLDYGLVSVDEVGVLPSRTINGKGHGGGRPAQEWSLTRKGRRIAELAFHLILNESLSRYVRMG